MSGQPVAQGTGPISAAVPSVIPTKDVRLSTVFSADYPFRGIQIANLRALKNVRSRTVTPGQQGLGTSYDLVFEA